MINNTDYGLLNSWVTVQIDTNNKQTQIHAPPLAACMGTPAEFSVLVVVGIRMYVGLSHAASSDRAR